MAETKWTPTPTAAYRLTLPQKGVLWFRRRLALPTRWERAAKAYLASGGRLPKPGVASDPDGRPPVPLPLPFRRAPLRPASVGAAVHIFYPEVAPEFRRRLDFIPGSFEVCVTTDRQEKRAAIAAAFAGWDRGPLDIRVVPNRGRDIGPKLVGCADLHRRCDIVLHLHSKKSPHSAEMQDWPVYLLDHLLGSRESVESILYIFDHLPEVGVIAPIDHPQLGHFLRWGPNYPLVQALFTAMGMKADPDGPLDFPSGSMFWARTAALRPLIDLGLTMKDFGPELRRLDGTLAHAIERSYHAVARHAGFIPLRVAAPGYHGGAVAPVEDEAALVAIARKGADAA